MSQGRAPLAAIAGVGTTRFGKLPGYSPDDLAGWALREALADAALPVGAIDGLVACRVSGYESFSAAYGLQPRWCVQLPAEGRMCGAAIELATAALAAGLCRTIALVYGNDGRSAGATYGAGGTGYTAAGEGYGTRPELTRPYGMTSPGAFSALMFQRHRHEYGTTAEQLAQVALTFRRHAALNPAAVLRDPLDLDTYLGSRYIVEPLHLFDYCLINDGGVAMILTVPEAARDLPQPPVYVLGAAQRAQFLGSDFPPEDYWRGALREVGDAALRQAGRERSEMDGLMSYDNFSPNVLFTLEGLGYCAPGESGPWIGDGGIGLGGQLPVNTSGGHLSESYLQGWGLNVEAVRQLRGQCGERQIPGAAHIQYACAAPLVSSVVYGNQP
ncbi:MULTISPECIES: thiolase family protein [Amycolatopsis]|uniref:Acetyl-CoA acetyltransferase n=2 Tax=Amycolatopsis TaxID=1813 RepID=A0A1I3WLW9_9PSEU|nr:thiolase family protein [Amycolatopsis sacchari]SFK08340.1 Acetyl-CoA acetyltransferase [Amycolatopsis sacchari]